MHEYNWESPTVTNAPELLGFMEELSKHSMYAPDRLFSDFPKAVSPMVSAAAAR